MDDSIGKRAEMEYLYDQPYDDPKRVRVAGPFTVESLSPHRILTVDAAGDPIQPSGDSDATSFAEMVLRQLRKAGVQQSEQSARITFDTTEAWQGKYVHAVGTYQDAQGSPQKAAITIAPEFGTVQRVDIVRAAREAFDAGFKLLIVCGFNFDAMSTEFSSLGDLQILKARMNTDLHMKDLADNGKGNLFVVFGEPDVQIEPMEDGQYVVSVKGVDVFDPAKNEIRSDDVNGIACWMVDTNYNSESFFVRHAYFLGASDPYNSLKSALGADVDPTAWARLNSAESRPFDLPETGQIAVKVINHLGDEVMRVFDIDPN